MQTDLPTFTAETLTNIRANEFVKFVACLADMDNLHGDSGAKSLSNELDRIHASEDFLRRWPRSLNIDLVTRAMAWSTKASEPGTSTAVSWAAPLAPIRPLISAFVELARPASLLGKLMASANNVPFNVSVPTATSGGTYRWVGQGGPKPVGNMALTSTTLPILKASGLVIVTNELMKLTAPASVTVLRREMIRGMSLYLDQQLTDPSVAAVAGVSPASITSGAPSVGSAGSSEANAGTDIKKLISDFVAANPNVESMVLLMSPGVAVAMAIATNSTTLGANGGSLFGVPVHTGSIGSRVIILDPTALLVADDGELDVTIARHASVEMDTTPTSPQTAGSVLVNLWSLNLSGLKIDRFVNYRMTRASAVLYTNVSYS